MKIEKMEKMPSPIQPSRSFSRPEGPKPLLSRLLGGLLPFLVAFAVSEAAPEFNVHPDHPRLFFRTSDWGEDGPTLERILYRARQPSSARFLEKLSGTLPNLALRSLILSDRQAVVSAIEKLTSPIEFENVTTDEGVEVAWRSMAFDWLYNDPDFSPLDKERAADQIAQGAEILIRHLSSGDHIFHTRMYGWATGIALAGLALSGHHPEADRFAGFGYEYYAQRLFPARRLQDGSVHNGFGYGRKYTMWLTAHFMTAWYTATGQNLWEWVRVEQGDWARREILFNIYGRYPDGSYLRFGDGYSLLSDQFTLRAISERAAAYRDSLGFGFLKFLLSGRDAGSGEPILPLHSRADPEVVDQHIAYTYFLFFDSAEPGSRHKSLPTKVLFSPTGTGMVIWKSNWDEDGTTIFFKCGDYFGDHGHFDQGHLDVFRRAPLLIDSGSYLTFSGSFRMDYWRKTVAHNTIVITDPNEPDEGGQRVFHSQDDSSPEEYEANEEAETGDIVEYAVNGRLAYVAGDLTAAYPRERVESVTRELAFLDDRFLLVRDRIKVQNERWVPRVLWHCPVVPTLREPERAFKVTRSGARVIVFALLPSSAGLTWLEGFQVAGRRIEPVGRLRGLDDMGAGRIEVTAPAVGPRFFEFVHLIDISDETDAVLLVRAQRQGDEIRVSVGGVELTLTPELKPPLVRGEEY